MTSNFSVLEKKSTQLQLITIKGVGGAPPASSVMVGYNRIIIFSDIVTPTLVFMSVTI